MFQVIIFVIFLAKISEAYETTRIDDIEGGVRKIEFDRNYNSYVFTHEDQGDVNRLYKLDTEKNVIFTEILPHSIENILISSINDVYLLGSDAENVNVRILKDGSESSEELYQFTAESCKSLDSLIIFMDKSDNIFHSTEEGIVIFKSVDTAPNLINGLENLCLVKAEEDELGNVYLLTQEKNDAITSVFVVTQDGKKEVPTAQPILQGADDPYERVTTIKVEDNGDVLIGGYNKLRKIDQDGIEVLTSEEGDIFCNFYPVNEKTFFVDVPLLGEKPCFLYYEKNDEIVQTHYLNEMASTTFCSFTAAKDKENNLYVGFYATISYIRLMMITPGDEIVRINFQSESQINAMLVDESDSLWLLLDHVYVLEKGSGEVVKVPAEADPFDWVIVMKENKGSSEIFLGALNGLFVISN